VAPLDCVSFEACLKRGRTQVADAKRRARLAEGTYLVWLSMPVDWVAFVLGGMTPNLHGDCVRVSRG
jgi:hypothetical protein